MWRASHSTDANFLLFCSRKKSEIGRLLKRLRTVNYKHHYYKRKDLFLGGKQHWHKLITGYWGCMEMSRFVGIFYSSRVLHSYKSWQDDHPVTRKVTFLKKLNESWYYSAGTDASLSSWYQKTVLKKKSKEKGEWAVKCSFLLLPIAENQHTKYQLLL